MPWDQRLREASYTSASGNSIIFLYEDVSTEFDKKTTAFNFPDADGTYVQNLGNTGRRFPLRVFISGSDYDLQANNFINILSESGIGRLSHPIYGVFDVVPFGTIKRVDNLKTASNEAIFEITFWQTIGLIYPTSQSDPASDVLTSVSEFSEQSSFQFSQSVNISTIPLLTLLQSDYNSLLTTVSNELRPIAEFQDDVRSTFNAIERSINKGISTFISDPISLAFQTIELIKTPARSLTNISDRLDAYFNLIDNVLTLNPSSNSVSGDNRSENKFYNNDLFVSSLLIGSVLSVVNNEFSIKKDAIESADNILTYFETIQKWRDDNYDVFDVIDTGELYQQLHKTVSLCAGFLVQISFSLKQENKIILKRDRSIIDLVAELYGSIDENLDFFINSNNLNGDEILELPRGREIVFYV